MVSNWEMRIKAQGSPQGKFIPATAATLSQVLNHMDYKIYGTSRGSSPLTGRLPFFLNVYLGTWFEILVFGLNFELFCETEYFSIFNMQASEK